MSSSDGKKPPPPESKGYADPEIVGPNERPGLPKLKRFANLDIDVPGQPPAVRSPRELARKSTLRDASSRSSKPSATPSSSTSGPSSRRQADSPTNSKSSSRNRRSPPLTQSSVPPGEVGELIDTDHFDEEVLQSTIPVLVHFWAAWCGPTPTLTPTLTELAAEYPDRLKVLRINTDRHPQLARFLGVSTMPATFLFKENQIIERIVGEVPKAAFVSAILPQM